MVCWVAGHYVEILVEMRDILKGCGVDSQEVRVMLGLVEMTRLMVVDISVIFLFTALVSVVKGVI